MLEAARISLEIPDDNSTVRLAYGARSPTGSAPAHNANKNVVYVTVNYTDDGYGKQHHISYKYVEGDERLTEIDDYTEEYSVNFSCYGEKAYENARAIRDWLYGDKSKSMFLENKIYFVAGSPQLVPTREVIDTIWVKRCDLTVNFYVEVHVERPDEVGWIENVEVKFNP